MNIFHEIGLTVKSNCISLKFVSGTIPVDDNGCVNCCMITIDSSDLERLTVSDFGLSLSDPEPFDDLELSGCFMFLRHE